MALGNLLGGVPAQTKQFQNFTPQQQGVQSNVLSQIMGILQSNQNRQPLSGSNQFDFAPIENQARKNFAQNTIPSLAERFTSMGGGQRSSAFQGALGNAGAGLEDSLAALKAQYDYQNKNQQQQFALQERGQENNLLSNLLGIGFQPSFTEAYIPRQPGLIESAGAGLTQGIGQLLPLLLGGGGQGLLQILSLLGSRPQNSPRGQSYNGNIGQFGGNS